MKSTISESERSSSTSSSGSKSNESSFFNKATQSSFFIQGKSQVDDKLFPTIGVYPVQKEGSIVGVRVIYIKTNSEGLEINYNHISNVNKAQIQKDANFGNFSGSVKIVTIGNQLYYQWENKAGEISKIPISNPKSKVPDGIFNQKEESILIPLNAPIEIQFDPLQEDE